VLKRIAYVLGGFALGIVLRRLFRRRRVAADTRSARPAADPRAENLRRRLAASREGALEETPETAPPGSVGEGAGDVDAERRRVHERGRRAADEMRGSAE
jgi:hypothetical protein